MGNVKFGVPIREEACTGKSGEHYLQYFYQYGSNGVSVGSRYVARSVLVGMEAITWADLALAGESAKKPYLPKGLHAAAATVVRFCFNHEEPVVEVVSNTIVREAGKPPVVIRGTEDVTMEDTPAGAVTHSFMPEAGDDLYLGTGRTQTAVYLPHSGYAPLKKDHQGILAYRGGDTNVVLFGVVNELDTVVTLPPYPDTRPEWQ